MKRYLVLLALLLVGAVAAGTAAANSFAVSIGVPGFGFGYAAPGYGYGYADGGASGPRNHRVANEAGDNNHRCGKLQTDLNAFTRDRHIDSLADKPVREVTHYDLRAAAREPGQGSKDPHL